MNKHKYKLEIDLNVLNHLGINLYSNVPAVLSELIANAWDADSAEVEVTTSQNKIVIKDKGCGMTIDEVNEKFLTVGYQRRKDMRGDITAKFDRKIMGRKGIGKLSVFSIANDVEIHTKKDGISNAFNMEVEGIQKAISQRKIYYPLDIKPVNIDNNTGTIIILKSIKKRVRSSIDDNLKKRISRRFDIFSDNFKVKVNGEKVTIEDRDYFHKLEFATKYTNKHDEYFKNLNNDRVHDRTDKLDGLDISGWIGLAKESSDLEEDGANLNKISILSRGKVALENILDVYRDGGLYTKFLIGEIRADFLDETDKEDIATSSRQDYIQNDERFIKLKKFIESELKYIQRERANYKEKEGTKKAIEIPEVKLWFNELKGDVKQSAKKLFGRINTIATDKENEKMLYKHGILAFENMRHKNRLQELDELEANNLEVAVQLFSELDDIEASWYYQITEGRLETISKLKDHIKKNDLEKIIQKHIYTHLWLLDPSWDRATEMPSMEESIKDELGKLCLTKEEKSGRFDIKYKKVSGKHVIIELKRNSVTTAIGALMDQVDKYKSATEKQLEAHGESGSVEVICLVGKQLKGWDDSARKQEDERALETKNIKVITYQQLIKDAENSYRSYLEKRKDKGRIQKILDSIDNF